MSHRLYVDAPLHAGAEFTLPPGPARHVQVLRLQPGDALRLFNGKGGQWYAHVTRMGRSEVDLRVDDGPAAHDPTEPELPLAVTLALGMPANERMDALVEKATELGVAAVQPLVCARSVLRLAGERADKRVAHWQGVAVAAAEQSGRTRVPRIEPVRAFDAWLAGLDEASARSGHLLCFAPDALPAASLLKDAAGGSASGATQRLLLSGPEGGLDPREEAAARQRGLRPLSLGPRVLRADTAPLAALAWLGLQWPRG